MDKIVTKASLANLLNNPGRRVDVIGRALVALLAKQTTSEQASNHTEINNNIGFGGCDAKAGSLSAKFYIKYGTLLDWQVARWMKPTKDGFPRLCKYHKQLNEIAIAKAAKKDPQKPLL